MHKCVTFESKVTSKGEMFIIEDSKMCRVSDLSKGCEM